MHLLPMGSTVKKPFMACSNQCHHSQLFYMGVPLHYGRLATHISDATKEARAIATCVLQPKRGKLLSRSHHFVPVAVEISGALDPDALAVCSLTLTSIRRQSHVNASTSNFFSIGFQQGNTASLLGTSNCSLL